MLVFRSSGADIVAPSDMMMEESSYSAQLISQGSTRWDSSYTLSMLQLIRPFKNRRFNVNSWQKTYQMNPANARKLFSSDARCWTRSWYSPSQARTLLFRYHRKIKKKVHSSHLRLPCQRRIRHVMQAHANGCWRQNLYEALLSIKRLCRLYFFLRSAQILSISNL